MKVKGKVFKYGNNVNTDVIIPNRYTHLTEASELAQGCLQDLDKDFVSKVKPGDVIVGGENFGCGSSREQAPLAIKGSGVGCVIAKGYARIFFRNSINIGLPILECSEAVDSIENGDVVEVTLDTGEIKDVTKGLTFKANAFPEFVMEIIKAGGLLELTKKKLAAKKKAR